MFIPLLSKPVLDEYRAVLSDDALLERFPELDPEIVEIAIRRLRFVSDYVAFPNTSFIYPRDPQDQKFIELAIAMQATHILSFDKDLLSLPTSPTEAGKRFRQRLPGIAVLSATTFMERHANAMQEI